MNIYIYIYNFCICFDYKLIHSGFCSIVKWDASSASHKLLIDASWFKKLRQNHRGRVNGIIKNRNLVFFAG